MGLRFRDQVRGSCFFVTTSFHQHRRLADIAGVYSALADSLCYYLTKYQARLPAYVFMPTHIHLLLLIEGDRLGGFMRDFKKFVSQKSIQDCGLITMPVWQHRCDRVVVQSEVVFRQKLQYIHQNPVKSGLTQTPEQWVWSSASAYSELQPEAVPVWKNWNF
jgi:putative transposase